MGWKIVLAPAIAQALLYNVQNLSAILDAARNISLAVSAVLLAVGSVTLVISGVGIMNIMLVTVSERTREIGVRKAIGAAKREILYQFLLEALIISGTGAVLGILIALGIPFILRPLMPDGLTIPISGLSIVVAFAVSCITGVVFGYLPATARPNCNQPKLCVMNKNRFVRFLASCAACCAIVPCALQAQDYNPSP